MKVIKRDGTEVEFQRKKIEIAISKANNSVKENERLSSEKIKTLSFDIEKKCSEMNRAVSVEDIQDIVENSIMELGYFALAKNYITYRYQRAMNRSKSAVDAKILSIVDQCNEDIKQENSNKNPAIVSTQRDYIAGETSKDISDRLLLPPDIVQADKEGIIHFHDKDYYICREYNCFMGRTKFITDRGVRQFTDFQDGDKIKVVDKYGMWRDAIVRKYGKQEMQDVYLTDCRTKKTITCTPNHRWILADGTVTTNLKVGDKLWQLQENNSLGEYPDQRQTFMFCLGFAIGDGCDIKGNRIKIRLCGEKTKYAPFFKSAGFKISPMKNNSDLLATIKGFSKQEFINSKIWKYLALEDKCWLFKGYYAADGSITGNRISISTTDTRLDRKSVV